MPSHVHGNEITENLKYGRYMFEGDMKYSRLSENKVKTPSELILFPAYKSIIFLNPYTFKRRKKF